MACDGFGTAWRRGAAVAALGIGLTACGPAEDGAVDDAADAPTAVQPSSSVDPSGTPPGIATKAIRDDRAQVGGQWAPPFDMRLIAVHMVLQPDGRVLYYGSSITGAQTGALQVGVWDPAAPPAQAVTDFLNPTGTDIFCSSQTLLTSGETLIVGGDQPGGGNSANNASTYFSGSRGTLTSGPQLNRRRWYSSTTMLMSGEVYIQGGSGGTDRPEIRGTDGRFRLLPDADTSALGFEFPRNWVAPDGRVFGIDLSGRMYYVDTSGRGAVVRAGNLPAAVSAGSSGSAMFRPGRILWLSSGSPAATVVDVRDGAPRVSSTEAASSVRVDSVATVLPDGRVLVTGGARGRNAQASAVNSAEVWNPVTGEWTIGPSQANFRLYHGSALLLHDGRVLVAGGGAPGPVAQRNGELYSPAYLFDAAGRPAARPRIDAAPTVVHPGRSFEIRTTGRPIARVTMVRFGSMSHSWNGDQRFVELPFRAIGAGAQAVQLPSRATDTPPGFYMLFAFDDAGVPSVARTVRILEPADPDAASAPTVERIADRTWATGPVRLEPVGRSPRALPLRWSASGLPPGLAIDPTTGAITGTPVGQGEFFVTVAADDGAWTGTTSFLWSVRPSDVRVEPLVSAGPAVTGARLTFTARATGAGLTYSWSFGDGTAPTARSTSPTITHAFSTPGVHDVTLTVYDALGRPTTSTMVQTVHRPVGATAPVRSSVLAWSGAGAQAKVWGANPDAGTVTAFDASTGVRLAEIPTGAGPTTLTVSADGRLWVANRDDATLAVMDTATNARIRTLALPRGSQPYGVLADPAGRTVWVVLEGGGRLLRFDAATYAQTGDLAIGPRARHLAISPDGRTVFVSRFVTPPMRGESTERIDTTAGGAEILRVDASTLRVSGTTLLRHSDRVDAENQGRGIPNYVGAMAISPDGTQAFVPSKQDNVARGTLRDGRPLDFQNTVRAVSSRIVMSTLVEDLASRIDHDNSSLASAAAFDPTGAILFVALETSREVAVLDAHGRRQLMRVDTGRAPQGLLVSPDGTRLYVANFMDRTVGVYDLAPLRRQGRPEVPLLGTLQSVGVEPLPREVLAGKQLFYDARDPRLSRDSYMSCASCHADGGDDGRVWDFTGFGEGLRNTVSLRGRAGGQGRLHWSGNFDEVQDFEGQIRGFAGGTGLMTQAQRGAGTRAQPLGDRKAGVSAELDALAAYVGSLTRSAPSPLRAAEGTLTAEARAGEALFGRLGCAECHGGRDFTSSASVGQVDVGTIRQPGSGRRLGAALTGIDPPTLRDAWASAPYLHDGSAPTLAAAIRAHRGVTASEAEVAQLARYVAEIGDGEAPPVGEAQGLLAQYWAGAVPGQGVLLATRSEAVDFDWGAGAPAGVTADRFAARWSGAVIAEASGLYRFQTVSDDGVRLWVDGQLVIDNWTPHGATVDTSAALRLEAGRRYAIRLEYFEEEWDATIRLRWQRPGAGGFVAIPAGALRSTAPPAPPGAAEGLRAEYFVGMVPGARAAAVARTEPVDFDWGDAAPAPGVPRDGFSVRWTGTVRAEQSGTFRFRTVSDDGIRLWVGGRLLVDRWDDHATSVDDSAGVELVAGQRYEVRLEYYENGGDAVARLHWLRPGQAQFEPIPAYVLAPPATAAATTAGGTTTAAATTTTTTARTAPP